MDARGLWIAVAVPTLGPAFLPTAATARDVATIIETVPRAPVQITDCRATYASAVVRASLDFVNVSEKTVTAIRVAFRAIDRSGVALRSGTANRLGAFAPRREVDGTSGAVTGLSANVANVICSVRMVRFDDDSVWRPDY